MEITSRVLGSGERNLGLVVKGILEEDLVEPRPVLEWKETRPPKIVSLLWVVQEKMGIHLWWSKTEPFLTMESRNGFSPVRQITPPEAWEGTIYMTAYGVKSNEYLPKHFWFTIEIDK